MRNFKINKDKSSTFCQLSLGTPKFEIYAERDSETRQNPERQGLPLNKRYINFQNVDVYTFILIIFVFVVLLIFYVCGMASSSSSEPISNQPSMPVSTQIKVSVGNLKTSSESSSNMAAHSESVSKRISTLNPVLGTAVGSDAFVKNLQYQRKFEELPAMELHSGEELRDDDDFGQPIRVRKPEGLGMNVPNESTSFKDKETVLSEIGSKFSEIEVIDVSAQETITMNLDIFLDKYFGLVTSSTPLNCLSLEVTNTRMGDRVQSPRFVRNLEWKKKSSSSTDVRKYFILSMENSYTDFHVDFGGSSVWYHVVKGAKTFYFVAPTTKNLSLFERWQRLQNQREIFFGDMVDKCYKLVLEQSETVIIPTGWIHGVLTTTKSVVYGGNFLNSLNIPLQIK